MSCSECVKNNETCYYDREQSVKCAGCLRHQRTCDGTFALEQFRKVGVEKKRLQSQAHRKRREALRLRKTLMDARKASIEAREAMVESEALLAEAEEHAHAADLEEAALNESIASLDERSSRMLRREMQALGVMDALPEEREVVLAEQDFVWQGMPITDSIDWESVFRVDGSIPYAGTCKFS